MKLYIDLAKAVQIPNTATGEIGEDQAIKEYEDSFKDRHSGVAAGEQVEPDTEESGKKWQGKDEVDTDGIKGNKPDIKKSFLEDDLPIDDGTSLLKSLSSNISASLQQARPMPAEVQFLLEQGHGYDEIVKGKVLITGRKRDLFQDWLCDRMHKSIDSLVGLIHE